MPRLFCTSRIRDFACRVGKVLNRVSFADMEFLQSVASNGTAEFCTIKLCKHVGSLLRNCLGDFVGPEPSKVHLLFPSYVSFSLRIVQKDEIANFEGFWMQDVSGIIVLFALFSVPPQSQSDLLIFLIPSLQLQSAQCQQLGRGFDLAPLQEAPARYLFLNWHDGLVPIIETKWRYPGACTHSCPVRPKASMKVLQPAPFSCF